MLSNHLILWHPLLLCLQSFPASGCFPRSQFFASGGQSIGASASTSVLPMNTQDWSPLRVLVVSQGTLKSLLQHHSSKTSILWWSAVFMVQLSYSVHYYWKNRSFDIWTFVGKVMSFLFNMLSRFVITFLPGIKNLLVSWLQSLSAVIFMSTKCLPYTILCALNSVSFHHHSNPLNVVLLLSHNYWWRNKGTSRLNNFVGSYRSYRLKWQIWDLNSLIQHSYISLEISRGQGTTLISIFNY